MKIEHIKVKDGVSKYAAIIALKKVFGFETLTIAKDYLEHIDKNHFNFSNGTFDFELEQDVINQLSDVLDFTYPQPNYWADVYPLEVAKNKAEYEEAEKWVETLSEKEKGYIKTLTRIFPAQG